MSIHDSSREEKISEGVLMKIRERLADVCVRRLVRTLDGRRKGSGMADGGSTCSARRLLDAPDCFSE